MTAGHPRFTSTEIEPLSRGREFGETWRTRVRAGVDGYRSLFARSGTTDTTGPGTEALARITAWAPELAAEIHGIAEGAGLPVHEIAAINARTEILAGPGAPNECTTLVALGGPRDEPIAAQNWDWYAGPADNWLEWEIPHADGRRTTTVTEFGIVGKIGVNDRSVGCLFNILHHRLDGGPIGVPVHVVARRVLDEADSPADALRLIGTAAVSASTTITVVGGLLAGKTAISAELSPAGLDHVLPDPDGLLVHTNHFLSARGAPGDTEPTTDPDTLVRFEVLRRRVHGRGRDLTAAEALAALADHTGGVCVHPVTDAPDEFRTLASVRVDFAERGLRVVAGSPCRATVKE